MSGDIQFILYNLPEEEGNKQKAMAQLFGVDRTAVSKHLKNIFYPSELQQDLVCVKFVHT